MPNAQQSHPADLRVPQHGSADNHIGAPRNNRADNYPSNHVERLAEARSTEGGSNNVKNAINTAKNMAEGANPAEAASIFKQMNVISDMPYVAAMGAAVLKDLLDFVGAATVVLPILFSVLCSIFIFMMMLMVGAGGKRKGATAIAKRIALLVGGGMADSVPGLGLFPFETLTVLVIYYMTLVERKNAQKE